MCTCHQYIIHMFDVFVCPCTTQSTTTTVDDGIHGIGIANFAISPLNIIDFHFPINNSSRTFGAKNQGYICLHAVETCIHTPPAAAAVAEAAEGDSMGIINHIVTIGIANSFSRFVMACGM